MGLSHTVSGDIASFRTPSRVPIESLKFHFLPKQAAGTPSPENPIPIEGWTGLNGKKSNKGSLFEQGGLADATGMPSSSTSTTRIRTYFIPYNGETQLIFDGKGFENDDQIRAIYWYDSSKSFISMSMLSKVIPYTYTVPSNSSFAYFRIVLWKTVSTDSISPTGKWLSVNQSLMPITFPDGQTIYGGYIDPVAGEIVAEYVSKICDGSETWNSNAQSGSNARFHVTPGNIGLPKPINSSTSFAKFNYFKSSTTSGSWTGFIGSTGNVLFYVPKTVAETISEWKAYLSEHNLHIVYKLETPIHIPIPAQDLQAFLDHNNFWSDANDITEVTYAVTESKDILATRKKAMDFDMGHRRKVKWNQVVRDGNFTGEKVDASKWASSRTDMGLLSISDNIATWTCTGAPSYYYQTGITWSGGSVSSYNYLAIPWNHLILVKCKVRCTIPCKVRLFALVGSGAHVWDYRENIEANTWTDVVGFIPDRKEVPTGEDDGFIKRFKPCITGISNISEVVVGTEFKIKELMAFDLTQMFGLDNEPQAVAEFERICALNGIDLTTYQPYDAGSDRWLIIP